LAQSNYFLLRIAKKNNTPEQIDTAVTSKNQKGATQLFSLKEENLCQPGIAALMFSQELQARVREQGRSLSFHNLPGRALKRDKKKKKKSSFLF
jgi:hypothetical protein